MLYIKLISVYIILLVVGYTSRKNDLGGGGGGRGAGVAKMTQNGEKTKIVH